MAIAVRVDPGPTGTWVLLDEHPDSINDGYFVNQAYSWKWLDLPASYHNGGTTFAYADGHSDIHRWIYPRTKPPSVARSVILPIDTPKHDEDFDWITERMSVEP